MPNATLIKIQMNQNVAQHRLYEADKQLLTQKLGATPTEKSLWHGTSATDPLTIMTSDEGLDMRYSSAGYWGKALYFAVNASYSADYSSTKDNNKQMFYAKVLIGDAIYLKHDKDTTSKLIKPPAKQNGSAKSKDYDSV